MIGLYFGKNEANPANAGEIHCYLPSDEEYFQSRYLIFEELISAPEPSLEGWQPDGSPIFCAESRSEETLKRWERTAEYALDLAEQYGRYLRIGKEPVPAETIIDICKETEHYGLAL